MEQKQISLQEVYQRLLLLEEAVRSKGIIIERDKSHLSNLEDEGEFTDEFKAELEKRKKTPESEYISFEDVKKRVLRKK